MKQIKINVLNNKEANILSNLIMLVCKNAETDTSKRHTHIYIKELDHENIKKVRSIIE